MTTTLDLPALPGPRGHWLLGNLPDFASDRLGFLTDCARRYGDCVPLRFAHRRVLLLSHPDLVEEVLVTKNRCFRKHFVMRKMRRTFGRGLLTSEADLWRRQRRLAQPAFHRERIASYADTMVALTERMLAGWSAGQILDVHDAMMRLTLGIAAKTLFGAEITDHAASASTAMQTLMRCFTARVNRPLILPEYVPTPVNLRLQGAARRLDRLVYGFIAERRARPEDRNDLLSMLLDARDEDGARMSDRQLRDEVMTLFLAGHETTANTLAWVWFLLATHPEAEAALHAEIDAVLGDRPPRADDLPRLVHAERVVDETLRVYPTVWLMGREAAEPCEIGGHPVAKGTTVYMSQWVIQRDPRFFEDPERFRPDRWTDGLAKRLHRYAYFPFGGGPRLCIGNTFALMETVLVLATVAQRYRLTLAPRARVKPWPTMTLRPESGVEVVLARRN